MCFIIDIAQTQNTAIDANLLFRLLTNIFAQILYITFTIFVSLFARSQGLAIAGSIVVIFFGSLLNALLVSQFDLWIVAINPLNMFNITLLNISAENDAYLLPFWQYALGIVIYSSLFYYLTNLFFKRRDIVFS